MTIRALLLTLFLSSGSPRVLQKLVWNSGLNRLRSASARSLDACRRVSKSRSVFERKRSGRGMFGF
jgi:hypothetical protein